jgi:hypothetical protein
MLPVRHIGMFTFFAQQLSPAPQFMQTAQLATEQ